MKTFAHHLPFSTLDRLTQEIFTENTLFFDIETTGFSGKYNQIYLIGCAYHRDGQLTVTQLFSESAEDETDVLRGFLALCDSFDTALTFNGIGFDIPFIRQRCQHWRISENMERLQQLDIYKRLSPLKSLLKLDSLKQKSLERFLSLHREDRYNGGELIAVYQQYRNDHSEEALALLRLHNYEDVLGMLDILPMLSYEKLCEGCFEITHMEAVHGVTYDGSQSTDLFFTLCLDYPVPRGISCGKDDLYLSADGAIGKVRVKLFEGELKYFYPNYRDYYYLPREDMAIHKSVAAYVDRDFRVKAKADNCYTKKQGSFLPQYGELFTPCFKKDCRDKISYVELTEELQGSREMQTEYVRHLLSHLVCRKR